jgi:hypothetical protein
VIWAWGATGIAAVAFAALWLRARALAARWKRAASASEKEIDEALHEKAGMSATREPVLREVIVSGRPHQIRATWLSYEDIAWMARRAAPGAGVTVTYHLPNGVGGTLERHQRVAVVDGIVFNVADSGNA